MCTYLAKRGATYYFRRVIPEELRAAFDGRGEWMTSLRTKDREEAKRRIPERTMATDRLMDEARAVITSSDPSTSPQRAISEAERERLDFEAAEKAAADTRWRARGHIRARLRRQMLEASHLLPEEVQAMRDLVREAAARHGIDMSEIDPSPPRKAAAKAEPLLALFDTYAADQQMKPGTRRDWRAVIGRLIAFLGHDDAARLTADDLLRWKLALQSEKTKGGKLRDPRTIRGTYLSAIRATLKWAVENRKLPANVAADITIRVPAKAKLRDRDFTADEAKAILSASLKPATAKASPELVLARRWIPWLCAYTGARVNELSQLRGVDVQQHEGGIWAIRITPEAGTVKSNAARVVPLHPHIVEQGFLEAIASKGDGPLFYDPSRQRVPGDHNRHFKKVGERLAEWVREAAGIADPSLQPNHGWRHSFKTAALAAGIPERIADHIQGHAPKSVGQSYGSVPLATAAAEIAKLPRFDVFARLSE